MTKHNAVTQPKALFALFETGHGAEDKGVSRSRGDRITGFIETRIVATSGEGVG